MLVKKHNGVANGPRMSKAMAGVLGGAIDRRTFLRRSGLTAGGAALASVAPAGMIRKAEAQTSVMGARKLDEVKSVCTHCSVGCTVVAEVDNGVWVGQEPGFDSPFNLGGHCCKGASVREHAHGERRLKYPMKLVDGKWQKISWEQAINEVGDKMLEIREASGPDSVYWLGSAKHNNEQAYLFRKFYAFWGSNNGDHQARICHSTTVAGVANTWGYGAMTNSYNDIHKSRAMFFIGSNPAEAHPVALLHILKAKEENNAPLIVCDPRFTRTAAHADEYVRLRPGTDVPLIWGMLWHIFENGWEDKEFIRQRVWGMDQIRAEVAKWTPEETERVTGVPGSQLKRVARIMATNRPGTVIWCMGGTQHTTGNNNTRAYCVLQLALGNMGVSGGGTNIFRGHDNVQGATDMGVLSHTLPGYYGLATGSWKHWARVWDVDYEYLKGRFATQELMESKGIPVSRWIDGVLENKDAIDQPNNLRAMVFWGHAPNSQTRLPDMKKAMEKLDLMVVIDPYPTLSAVMSDRKDGVYLLPAATQFETYGSVTASNRSLQWREKIIDPVFEAKTDHEIMYLLAKKFGFDQEMFKHIEVNGTEPLIEDITREFNKGMWTIGYTGQSPERLRQHMAEPVHLRQDDVAGPGRAVRRRILRPAVAGLGNAGDGPPRNGEPVRHVHAGGGGRPVLPGPVRRRARRREPVGGGFLSGGLGNPGRLSRIHHGHASEARLGRRSHRRRAQGHRGHRRRKDQLEDRPFGRDPAGGHQAWLRALRQRQGPVRGVDVPRSGAHSPRTAVHVSTRSGGRLPDLRGHPGLSPADALRVHSEERLLR